MNLLPLAAFVVVLAAMLVELRLSRQNERRLRASGAVEPAGDVYRWMRLVYPACFVAMAIEGMLAPRTRLDVFAVGVLVFAASKALKSWAIVSLGEAWSFRVLVRPPRPLVSRGPYKYLRHPNYVAVIGEILAMALLAGAPVTGALSIVAMVLLLRRRIAIEERALGLRG